MEWYSFAFLSPCPLLPRLLGLFWPAYSFVSSSLGYLISSKVQYTDTAIAGERGQGRDAGFFVFPDLSVRTEGTYRLKLTLFEVIGANVHHCKSIFSAPFYVYTAKKFPGMEGEF